LVILKKKAVEAYLQQGGLQSRRKGNAWREARGCLIRERSGFKDQPGWEYRDSTNFREGITRFP
jgi:hypothetical protein